MAPLKTLSIPKLELSAAVLAVRLDIMIRKELALNNCSSTFWSDSTAVLQVIKNSNKRFPVFVANRISVIETHTNIDDWRYVPSKQNPADLASRGCAAKTLVESKFWYLGPEFLWKTEDYWPQGITPLTHLPEFDKPMQSISSVFLLNKQLDHDVIDQLIGRYSSLNRLKKAAAWLLRAKCFLRTKAKNQDSKFDLSDLTVQDLQNAEIELIKHEQIKYFSNVIFLLRNGTLKKSKIPRLILKLSPILAENVLRVGGRLQNTPICFD